MTHLPATSAAAARPAPVLPAARRLFPFALLAVLGALPALPGLLAPLLERTPGAPPLTTVLAASGLQLFVLVTLGVFVGAWAAPRAGFHSHVAQGAAWDRLKPDLRAGLLPGVLVGVAIVALDALSAPLLGEAWAAATQEQPRTPAVTLSGLLYGGIGEELQMRWALVSLLTLGLWRALARTPARTLARPPAWAALTAVLVVAVLFGLGHLGAVAAITALTPAIVARTVLLNALGGVVYGLLFTRRSLESAVAAHAVTHLTMTALLLGLGR